MFPVLFVVYRKVNQWSAALLERVEKELDGQREYLERLFGDLESRRDIIIDESIDAAIKALSEVYKISEPDPFTLFVPEYDRIPTNSWEQLSENYDSYVNISPGDNQPFLLDDLENVIRKLRRASMGVAGERGAGKTSLLQALRNKLRKSSEKSREFLELWISAPTSVTEEVFLLSVLGKLATKAGVTLTGNDYFPNIPPETELQYSRRRRRIITLAFVASIIAAGVSLLAPLSPTGRIALTVSLLLIGPLCALAWQRLRHFVVAERFFKQRRREDEKFLYASQSLLEQLWFDQRETTTSSFKVAGAGLDFTGALSRERKRRPFTLPQLVQMWDDFVKYLTTGQHSFGKIVVFIDEVDKIKDTEEIGRFMRILKTLYRQPRLFFIVSISEDAYEQFRARAVARGQRNEFDSSFDRLIWVELMTYEGTKELLRKRIIGEQLPHPFVQLICAISRGNPRDTVRMARDILQWYQGKELRDVACYLVRKYQFEPAVDQYRERLKGLLTPGDHQEIFQAVSDFLQKLEENIAQAHDSVMPLSRVIQKHITAVEELSVRELLEVLLDDKAKRRLSNKYKTNHELFALYYNRLKVKLIKMVDKKAVCHPD